MRKKIYVQDGCGNKAISGWINYDASPTLRIQKTPILGHLIRSKLNCIFDRDVRYGDIVKGLPHPPGSVDAVFCSHVVDHGFGQITEFKNDDFSINGQSKDELLTLPERHHQFTRGFGLESIKA